MPYLRFNSFLAWLVIFSAPSQSLVVVAPVHASPPGTASTKVTGSRVLVKQVSASVQSTKVQFDQKHFVLQAPERGLVIISDAPFKAVTVVNNHTQEYFETDVKTFGATFRLEKETRAFSGAVSRKSLTKYGIEIAELYGKAKPHAHATVGVFFQPKAGTPTELTYTYEIATTIDTPASAIVCALDDVPVEKGYPLLFGMTLTRGRPVSALFTSSISRDDKPVEVPTYKGYKKAESVNKVIWSRALPFIENWN